MAFKTKELIFIALMAALLFVMNFTLGAGVIAVTGIPGSSALVDGITNLVVLTFVALTVRKFGTIGLLYLVYAIIALPTHMAGGPPGFIWKVPLLAGSALIFDLVIWIRNYRKSGFIFGLPLLTVGGFALYLGTFYLLGLPEFERIFSAFIFLAVAFIIEGYVGMWLGFLLYKKLKNKRILKQITA